MPPNVLCSVCRVEEHEELIEPVITSCGHLFCWPCLYTWVKTKTAAGDYPCPMCRLLVSAVTSDLSRGMKNKSSSLEFHEDQDREFSPLTLISLRLGKT